MLPLDTAFCGGSSDRRSHAAQSVTAYRAEQSPIMCFTTACTLIINTNHEHLSKPMLPRLKTLAQFPITLRYRQ